MNALLNLTGIIKKLHGALPDQPGSRLTAPWLKLRGRSKNPYPGPSAPYSAQTDFQCQHPERQTPGQEVSIGLLPDAVRPLEAELCRFVVSGSTPLAKTTKPWCGSPFQRKKLKLVCYPQSDFFEPNGAKKCHSGDLL